LLNNISASYYHAGLSIGERNKRQESWINNITRVMACTNAFGMGIDKANVRVVVHYDVPECLENYYQEAGRAGRDGKRAYAVLLYGSNEPDDLLLQPGIRFPPKDEIKKVYTAIMNYRQIAAGSGEGMSFDFDLASFAAAFKIDILTATYAIKTLEQENILSYNENFFKPSTLEFSCGKNQLLLFEQQYPKFEPLVKGLLRSYEGVFDFPVTIYETELAKFIQKNLPDVQNELEQLNQLGLVNYSPKKDSPQITLLQNRMYADSFVLNLADYLKRKENFEIRVKAIINYIQEPILCRSKMIAAYFNDMALNACGICDNCINQANLVISAEEFKKISDKIFDLVDMQPLPPTELIKKITGTNKAKCWKVVDYLLAEKKINVTKEGEMKKR
jgi:ATP-dependent DNA helicase RecQ